MGAHGDPEQDFQCVLLLPLKQGLSFNLELGTFLAKLEANSLAKAKLFPSCQS